MKRLTLLLLLLAPVAAIAATTEVASPTGTVSSSTTTDPLDIVQPSDLSTQVNPITYTRNFTNTEIDACVKANMTFNNTTVATPDFVHKCSCLVSVFSNRAVTQTEYATFRTKANLSTTQKNKALTRYRFARKECLFGRAFPRRQLFPALTTD
jgi:hypothetical protein